MIHALTFQKALAITLNYEGFYAPPPDETFRGISRNHHPDHDVWEFVDAFNEGHISRTELDIYTSPMIENFYYSNFWRPFTRVATVNPSLAVYLFDAGVNSGPENAIRFLQRALNTASNSDLEVDGILGNLTFGALLAYRGDILNCVRAERYIHYKSLPNHHENPGWFKRV